MSATHAYGFIPARYASTRFPGKPLALIHGKPMFWHVWKRASQATLLREAVLCTDDARIQDAAEQLGVPVVMTRPEHASGTDRIYEAAMAHGLGPDDVVVNIQGDEPALNPAMLDTLLAAFADADTLTATLAHPISAQEAASPDRVKVVCDAAGYALYFSRSPIPYDREGAGAGYLLHLGIYGYRMRALAAFTAWPPSRLEELEKLEQLRFLENGVRMRVCLTEHACHGVDTPEDLEAVARRMDPAEYS